jgi:hypothetical protein
MALIISLCILDAGPVSSLFLSSWFKLFFYHLLPEESRPLQCLLQNRCTTNVIGSRGAGQKSIQHKTSGSGRERWVNQAEHPSGGRARMWGQEWAMWEQCCQQEANNQPHASSSCQQSIPVGNGSLHRNWKWHLGNFVLSMVRFGTSVIILWSKTWYASVFLSLRSHCLLLPCADILLGEFIMQFQRAKRELISQPVGLSNGETFSGF